MHNFTTKDFEYLGQFWWPLFFKNFEEWMDIGGLLRNFWFYRTLNVKLKTKSSKKLIVHHMWQIWCSSKSKAWTSYWHVPTMSPSLPRWWKDTMTRYEDRLRWWWCQLTSLRLEKCTVCLCIFLLFYLTRIFVALQAIWPSYTVRRTGWACGWSGGGLRPEYMSGAAMYIGSERSFRCFDPLKKIDLHLYFT